MYSAIYLPVRPPHKEDPSRKGFPTRESAEEYVFSQMCYHCKEERRMALAGEVDPDDPDYPPSAFPGCYFEWVIGLTEEFDRAKDDDEFWAAGGWEKVYTRPESQSE